MFCVYLLSFSSLNPHAVKTKAPAHVTVVPSKIIVPNSLLGLIKTLEVYQTLTPESNAHFEHKPTISINSHTFGAYI
eukprot:10935439-Heterocapsa_arctica.AAC.1